jgi:sulfur relay (sulfurtransferase) DsrF/TusC family protein
MKEAVILIRSGPYGEASSAEGLRVIMTLPAMGIQTTAVALEDGVFCLLKDGDGTRVGWRGSVAEAFAQIQEYDSRLMVHRPSALERGIRDSELVRHDGWLDEEGFQDLLRRASVILAF